MTEDVKTEVKEVKEEAKEEIKEAPKLEGLEARAADQGWQPLEEWVASGHDAADHRDARAFLDRGEILSRVSQQNKEIKELRKTLKAYEEHNKKLSESKFSEKLVELRSAKKQALEAGDAARVVELDEQIDIVKDAAAENKATTSTVADTPEQHPEFQSWVDKNSWYATNDEMRMFADNVGTAFARLNRDKSPKDVLKYVEQRVRRAYSDQFVNTKRELPSKVEASGRITHTKKDDFELPPEAQQVMKTLVRSGTMTEAEYIKQYKLMNK